MPIPTISRRRLRIKVHGMATEARLFFRGFPIQLGSPNLLDRLESKTLVAAFRTETRSRAGQPRQRFRWHLTGKKPSRIVL